MQLVAKAWKISTRKSMGYNQSLQQNQEQQGGQTSQEDQPTPNL